MAGLGLQYGREAQLWKVGVDAPITMKAGWDSNTVGVFFKDYDDVTLVPWTRVDFIEQEQNNG